MARESNGGEGSFDALFLKEDAALELENILRVDPQTPDRNCVDNERTANLESGH
jgi:hypothetical protein